MKQIYLDYAATTPVAPEVKAAMEPYFTEKFGNPSSLYAWGREARGALDEAREKVAAALGSLPDEIVFTSGATESNNLALKGIAFLLKKSFPNKNLHIITTAIEHHSVLHVAEYLEKFGISVTYVPVSKEGIVDPQKVADALRDETILISLMYANNEIGTIQPIAEVSEIIKEEREKRKESGNKIPIFFHTDAVQAAQYLNLNVKDLGVDLLSLTGHKFYAPKGVGILYKSSSVPILAQQQGGGHERNLRAGTENVPYIVGLAEALEKAQGQREQESKRLTVLRDKLISGILEEIPDVFVNGSRQNRLPNNVNICVKRIEGEGMLLKLDNLGIACSTGSACTSAKLEPSHVLLAIGVPKEIAHGSLRFTLGKDTKDEDIDYVLEVLPKVVEELRAFSPVR